MERIQGPNRNARVEAPPPHHGTAGRRDDGVLTANSADGKAKLYLNADRIGNVADAPSDIMLTLAVVGAGGHELYRHDPEILPYGAPTPSVRATTCRPTSAR